MKFRGEKGQTLGEKNLNDAKKENKRISGHCTLRQIKGSSIKLHSFYITFIFLCYFLGATKHLYNWLCPSVGLLVCNAFVRRSTRRTYWPTWPCFLFCSFSVSFSFSLSFSFLFLLLLIFVPILFLPPQAPLPLQKSSHSPPSLPRLSISFSFPSISLFL